MSSKENKKHPNEGSVYMSTVTIQKWGNSLGIRIPKEVTELLSINQGAHLELTVKENENIITLKPQKVRKQYSLEELLSQITPENRHEEFDFGTEGRELI